jgi:5-methylcytosine-specific restriction enzyme subunit McrC
MNSLTVFEFGKVVEANDEANEHAVPARVFAWLESQCRRTDDNAPIWLKHAKMDGRRAVQFANYVGVVRAPCGYQIEVLPKVGKDMDEKRARQLLIDMLLCLNGFRHIKTDSAKLASARMPLFEVFIKEFLLAVEHVVKRGVRSDYVARQDNLFALRGKLLIAQQIRQNLHRADRFFTEHDEFSPNRPENRLLHTALRQVLSASVSQDNQRLARELCFVFADIPASTQIAHDFQQVRLDRGMDYYADALVWARLILEEQSPLTGSGTHLAPSLLFPMEALFEAFVAKHLSKKLVPPFKLKTQARSHHLVQHLERDWFLLKPDMLIRNGDCNQLVLDTKWKLLDALKGNAREKYQLSQSDFYQLYAYGQHYLDGRGDIVLIYPKTDAFAQPLPVFAFPKAEDLRLWVLPFCLTERRLILPESAKFNALFCLGDSASKQAF